MLPAFSAARRAFTLVEASLTMLIVSLILVAALQAAATTARVRNVRAARSIGASLARDLMNEILAQRYEEPDNVPTWGRESGEPTSYRSSWDDVDDYDGWSASPPQGRDGWGLDGMGGWTREVIVERVLRGAGSVTGTDTGLVRIHVTAISPTGAATSFVALRSRHGAGEQPPIVDSTFVSWVGVKLRAGPGQTPAITGTPLVNHVSAGEP